jgi:hypothetical protein
MTNAPFSRAPRTRSALLTSYVACSHVRLRRRMPIANAAMCSALISRSDGTADACSVDSPKLVVDAGASSIRAIRARNEAPRRALTTGSKLLKTSQILLLSGLRKGHNEEVE